MKDIIQPPIWRRLISSLPFFLYGAVFAFGCYYYFTDPEIAADVKGSPIMLVFILSIPSIIYLFLKMLDTFSLKLEHSQGRLIFFSLFSRFKIALTEIEHITITSPDLVETDFSGPTQKPVRFSGHPIRLYVGAPHILQIKRKGIPETIGLKIGPGWKKEDLQRFINNAIPSSRS